MRRWVKVQGHTKALSIHSLACSCGDVEDYTGVSFQFDDEGPWVIGLDELKAIVAAAEAEQSSPEHLARVAHRKRKAVTP